MTRAELCSSRYWFKGGCVISNTRFNSSAHKSSFKVPRKINITEKRIYTCHTFQLSAQNTPLSSCVSTDKESLCDILFKSWLCSVGFYWEIEMHALVVDKRPTWFWCRPDLSLPHWKIWKTCERGFLLFRHQLKYRRHRSSFRQKTHSGKKPAAFSKKLWAISYLEVCKTGVKIINFQVTMRRSSAHISHFFAT